MRRYLFLFLACLMQFVAMAQDKNVEIIGTVTDNEGEPAIGATVIIKNQPGLGSTTNADGKFKIKARDFDVLEVSYVGFKTKEVPILRIKDKSNVLIKLEPETQAVDEVVVTASGRQKKKTLTGALTVVNVEELNAPSGNLTNSLGGVVPGIITQQLSGEPGENQSEFWIRGISTFGANS